MFTNAKKDLSERFQTSEYPYYQNPFEVDLSTDEITEILGEQILMIIRNPHIDENKKWLVLMRSEKSYYAKTLRDALVRAYGEAQRA